jgi:hypothetical protein
LFGLRKRRVRFGTTKLTLAFGEWDRLGQATEASPGRFEAADASAPTRGQPFYRVSSPCAARLRALPGAFIIRPVEPMYEALRAWAKTSEITAESLSPRSTLSARGGVEYDV